MTGARGIAWLRSGRPVQHIKQKILRLPPLCPPKASYVLADAECGTSSLKILCMKQLLRWFDTLRGDVPDIVSNITEYLGSDTSTLGLGVKYDTRNGWKQLSRFAKKFDWKPDVFSRSKATRMVDLQKLAVRMTDEVADAESGSAAERWRDRRPVEPGRMAPYLARRCRIHLRNGRRF